MNLALRALCLGLALLVANGSEATAGRLFVMEATTLREIDPTNGKVMRARTLSGFSWESGALAYEASTDTLFMLDLQSRLYRIDYVAAVATLVGDLNLPIAGGAFGHGLTVDGAGDLYAYVRAAPPSIQNLLVQVDRTTGQGTIVASLPYSGYAAIEYVPSTGKAYLVDLSGFSLREINLATGATTLVGPFGAPSGSVGRGLAWDATYGLMATTDLSSPALYSIDTTTGAATFVAPLSGDPSSVAFVADNSTPSTSFCAGDGSAAACPCGNVGAVGAGCASSLPGVSGRLYATGVAGTTMATDSLCLAINGIYSTGLIFQGTTRTAGGLGTPFGDGLRCVGGSIRRLAIVSNVGGLFAQYPSNSSATPLHVLAQTSAGDVRHYQGWYRDSATYCSADTFNLTQGLTLTWVP